MLNDDNSNRFAKKTFNNKNEFKHANTIRNDGSFYMRFKNTVSSSLFDHKETKKNKQNGSNKKSFKSIFDNVSYK